MGSLDAESTGLLLLTNDGELANLLTHPRYEVPKAYRAGCDGHRPRLICGVSRGGVELEDGPTAPARVRRLGEREIEIVLREGRNRQVRRMAEAIGNEVVALRRVRFGPIELGKLPPGEARRSPARGRGAPSPVIGVSAVLGRPWRGKGAAASGSGKMPAMSEERLFAVRGAVQAEANEADAILAATRS